MKLSVYGASNEGLTRSGQDQFTGDPDEYKDSDRGRLRSRGNKIEREIQYEDRFTEEDQSD